MKRFYLFNGDLPESARNRTDEKQSGYFPFLIDPQGGQRTVAYAASQGFSCFRKLTDDEKETVNLNIEIFDHEKKTYNEAKKKELEATFIEKNGKIPFNCSLSLTEDYIDPYDKQPRITSKSTPAGKFLAEVKFMHPASWRPIIEKAPIVNIMHKKTLFGGRAVDLNESYWGWSINLNPLDIERIKGIQRGTRERPKGERYNTNNVFIKCMGNEEGPLTCRAIEAPKKKGDLDSKADWSAFPYEKISIVTEGTQEEFEKLSTPPSVAPPAPAGIVPPMEVPLSP